ncbi:MAG: putative DNA-binding domain-containing protein [Deltaproteobacteria bacterium]|nr:putative DNA-binding domain-containing protein [Deltaproteobacteria bacterium]
MKLVDVQTLFDGVLRGDVPESDARVREAFVSDGKLAADARLHIYADMFLARQVDALRGEFPLLTALLGDHAFFDLARQYIRSHPSEHPDIGQLGRKLPEFIRGHDVRGDLAELAELEHARSTVFAAADAVPATWDALVALGQDAFASVRVKFVPALETHVFAHDLEALAEKLHEGETPEPIALEAKVTLVVWRQGFDVFHVALSANEAEALARARAGATLAEVCDAFAAEEDAANVALSAIASWFNEGWIAELITPAA